MVGATGIEPVTPTLSSQGSQRGWIFGFDDNLFCIYDLIMFITWDEPKRLANIDKQGLDFADLADEYFLRAIVVQA